MKKVLGIFLMVLFLWGCSSQEAAQGCYFGQPETQQSNPGAVHHTPQPQENGANS